MRHTYATAMTDAELMQQVAQGHIAALETLYDRYANLVYSFAMRMVGDPEAAREAARHAFMLVWERRHAFTSTDGFDAWLLGQVHQIGVAELRFRRAAGSRAAAPPGADEVMSDGREVQPDLDVTSELDEHIARKRLLVRRALETLTAEQRRTVELSYFQGYAQEEIARLTGEPLATVMSHLRLSLLRLREVAPRVATHVEG